MLTRSSQVAGVICDCLMWCSVVKAIEGDGTMSVQLWPALKPDAKVNFAATEVTLHCTKLKEEKRAMQLVTCRHRSQLPFRQ